MTRKKLIGLLSCMILTVGVVGALFTVGLAKPECTCRIKVHGSNCPLSGCTCSWKSNHYDEGRKADDHDKGCLLYGASADALQCVCEVDVHAEGCPRYEKTQKKLTLTKTPAADSVTTEAAETEAAAAETTTEPATTEPATTEVVTTDATKKKMTGTEDTEAAEKNTENETEPETRALSEETTSAGQTVTERPEESLQEPDMETVTSKAAETEQTAEKGTEAKTETEAAGTEEGGEALTEEAAEPESSKEETKSSVSEKPDATEKKSKTKKSDETAPVSEESSETADGNTAEEDIIELEPEEGLKDNGEKKTEWKYPTGWEGYGTGRMSGNVLVALEAYRMPLQLKEQTKKIAELLPAEREAELCDSEDNFYDILAVYAFLSGQTEDYPLGLVIEEADFESVYWRMTQVTGVTNADGSLVYVHRLRADEAAEIYGFSKEDMEEINTLLDRSSKAEKAIKESIFASLSKSELQDVLDLIPEGLSPERKAILTTAVALNRKLPYFWGGKSLAYGWDDRWGETRTVSCEGSKTYGTYRPLGLDCSGFVSWAFINYYGADFGTWSSYEWGTGRLTYPVSWKDAQPGDIALTEGHVGIVLTVDENGPTSYIHCGGAGVRVTTRVDRFKRIARPYIFGEEH